MEAEIRGRCIGGGGAEELEPENELRGIGRVGRDVGRWRGIDDLLLAGGVSVLPIHEEDARVVGLFWAGRVCEGMGWEVDVDAIGYWAVFAAFPSRLGGRGGSAIGLEMGALLRFCQNH